MGLISIDYHLVPLTSHFPFVGAAFSTWICNYRHLPRPCLAKRCWDPAVNANIPWHSTFRVQGVFGQCSWSSWLPQLKVVSQEWSLRGAEVQQLSGRRWQKESRIGVTEKEGTGNYTAKGKNPWEKDASIRQNDEKGVEGKENRDGRKEKKKQFWDSF